MPSKRKVIIIGDSISAGYTPFVQARLKDSGLEVIRTGPKPPSGSDSSMILAQLDALAISHQPDLIHFNCGHHDMNMDIKNGTHQQELPAYEANLRKIIKRLKKETSARLLWATCTPVIEQWHHKEKPSLVLYVREQAMVKPGGSDEAVNKILAKMTAAGFAPYRANKFVVEYNTVALRIMKEYNIPVNDLYAVLMKEKVEKIVNYFISSDGSHMTEYGNILLAEAVTDGIRRQMA